MRDYLDWRASIIIIGLAVVLVGGIDQSTRDALKVKDILGVIEKHPFRPDAKEEAAEITEEELNAYISYRLEREKSSPVNNLKVGLLDNDNIQGKVSLDGRRLNLDAFFGAELDLDFKGMVQTRNGAARLDLTALQLNGSPVQPGMLDMVLGAAALYSGEEIGRIGDWYAMPKGIKRIRVMKGRAVLYY